MSLYRASGLKISSDGICLRGIPFPLISRMTIEWSDVQNVQLIDCSVLHRFHFAGPDLLGRWWVPDPLSPLRSHALVVQLRESIFGFDELALTGNDIDFAYEVARSYLP